MALRDPEYARSLYKLKSEAADLIAFRRAHWKSPKSVEELRHIGDRVKTLTEAVEAPARAAEKEVWRELTQKWLGK